MSARPAAVIGLDAMDPDLVRQWAASGDLPHLAKVLPHASQGRVTNPPWFEAGAAWSTFFRGLEPDQTGLWDGFHRLDTERYALRNVRRDEVPSPQLWRSLSEQGRRITLIDPPYELMDDNVEGIQVIDWMSHVRTGPHWLDTRPAGLAETIRQNWGENPWVADADPCPTNQVRFSNAAEVTAFADALVQRVEAKTGFTKSLLAGEPADLFCVVFHEAHDVGHMAWHVHDSTHELYDPAVAEGAEDPILQVYRAMDQAVGELLPLLDDHNVLILFSHGMAAERTGTRLLDEALEVLASGGRQPVRRPPDTFVDRAYRHLLPASLRDRLRSLSLVSRRYEKFAQEKKFSRPYFEQTPNQAVGGVRLNLIGREKYGVVEPGAQADAMLDRLMEQLASIRNADNGEPFIAAMQKTADIYRGPHAHQLPDLLLRWHRGAPVRRLESPELGVLENRFVRPRTGDHLPDGFYLAMGPDVPGGVNKPVRMTDFAATLGAWLDIELLPPAVRPWAAEA
ncbi:MAG: alkaline phosphatase family protein [Gammaproteobacteria bacterium]